MLINPWVKLEGGEDIPILVVVVFGGIFILVGILFLNASIWKSGMVLDTRKGVVEKWTRCFGIPVRNESQPLTRFKEVRIVFPTLMGKTIPKGCEIQLSGSSSTTRLEYRATHEEGRGRGREIADFLGFDLVDDTADGG